MAKRGIGMALGLALATAAGCQSSKQGSDGTFSLSDRVEYSAAYDKELEFIFSLSEKGKWEEAEAEVGLLLQKHPDDVTLKRINAWVTTQKTLLREQAIEDRIRTINAKQTGMTPSIRDIWAVSYTHLTLPTKRIV